MTLLLLVVPLASGPYGSVPDAADLDGFSVLVFRQSSAHIPGGFCPTYHVRRFMLLLVEKKCPSTFNLTEKDKGTGLECSFQKTIWLEKKCPSTFNLTEKKNPHLFLSHKQKQNQKQKLEEKKPHTFSFLKNINLSIKPCCKLNLKVLGAILKALCGVGFPPGRRRWP